MNSTSPVLQIAHEYGSDLSSRSRGAALRIRIESEISAAQRAILDFAAVRTVSDSFADEVLGVLLAQHGQQWVAAHVVVRNASHLVRLALLESAARRIGNLPASA